MKYRKITVSFSIEMFEENFWKPEAQQKKIYAFAANLRKW